MDEELFAIIENEREQDEAHDRVSDWELAPVAAIEDGEGGLIEVFRDGSYVVTWHGEFAPRVGETP